MRILIFFVLLLQFCQFASAQCPGDTPNDCTYDESDLIGSSGVFTVATGEVLCISATTCIGAASNWPGSCSNTGPSSLILNGKLRICPNAIFKYQGAISGNGEIQYLNNAEFNHFGNLSCNGGLKMKAVDPDYATDPTNTTINSDCNSNDLTCSPQITVDQSYYPYGIVSSGLGFTTDGGCPFIGYPTESAVLPVELISFKAETKEGKVVLKWKTAIEVNNHYFAIEHSINASEWTKIDEVRGQGTSTSISNYQYLDETPVDGISYYRLKQVDFNEEFEYSSIESIELELAPERLSVFPNPFNESFTIETSGATLKNIKVYDLFSNELTSLVKSVDLTKTSLVISMPNLNSGMYFIKTDNGVIKVNKY